MKSGIKKVKDMFSAFFFMEEGGKKVIKSKKVKIAFSIILILVCGVQIFFTEDNSSLGKSYKPLSDGQDLQEIAQLQHQQRVVDLQTKEQVEQMRASSKMHSHGSGQILRPKQIVYRAKQVIGPGAEDGLMTPLPSGTNFIGKLLNGIDTREANQIARVTLPYGARHVNGGSIPKNSILLGSASSSGSEKVFIRFTRVIYPNGEEYRIDAQALNSGDYSPGLLGVRQSNADLRMVGSIGLTMVSAATDVLTQRSMVGMNPYAMGVAQPDATAQNAVLQGVSQVTKQEAQKQAQEPQNSQDYVTVFPDSDLIVNLLSPFKEEEN